jgi:hypothetical protein
MKNRILKDAEGNEVNITELESFSSMDELVSNPEEAIRRADQEVEDDQRLDDLASRIIPLFTKAGDEDRTVIYWQIGEVINSYEKKLPKRNIRESWLMKSNILERLAQKINRKGLSRRHLEEMILFNGTWKQSDINEKIPWSFYAELAIKAKRIDRRILKRLEKLILSGQITDHKSLRNALEKYISKGK